MTRRFGWALVSALLITSMGAASAADMSMPMKAPPPVRPMVSWTGCYLEGGVGYGMWNQDQYTETFPGLVQLGAATTTDGGRGWLGRIGGGCDWQLTGEASNWVIGGLAEYDFMGIKGTDNFQNVGLNGVFGAPSYAPEKESSAWYIGPRVGYIVTPNLLTYVSGGYTETHFNQQNFTFLNTGVSANASLPSYTAHGWFIGSGVDYALNMSWLPIQGLFWRNDYRYSQYNAKDLQPFGTGVNPGFAQHTTANVQTVTTSLVWKFNWGGPGVAHY